MSVGRSGVGRSLQELRKEKGLSQQQMSFDLNVSRESVSAYETGRARVPKDISRKITEKFDDPFFAMVVRREYTGTGPIKLDGQYVDLHRSSVKAKLLEEMTEAKQAVNEFDLVNQPESLKTFEREKLIQMLTEVVDVATAIEHFVGVICNDYDINYTDVWKSHYQKLIANRYVRKESLKI